MSDFFSGIYAGSSGPDIVMNEGPLPPTDTSGMPAGFNGTPDARIDYSSTLMGDMDPYAYGGPGRLSTQAAYLNIPHVAQRIIPQIQLPEQQPQSRGGGFMGVNHQVDDGDVAFIVRAMFSPFDLVSDKKKYNRQGILYAIDPVVNLATANYILHGLQRYGFDNTSAQNWHTLWVAFGIDKHFEPMIPGTSLSQTMKDLHDTIEDKAKSEGERRIAQSKMYLARKRLAQHIVRNVITPFGIPRGSERQGGQHQGIVNRSVTNPVDFVTALVIDGKAINLANFWREDDISAGDDLILFLEERPYVSYTLSHNPRSRRTVSFEPLSKWNMHTGVVGTGGLCNPKLVGVRHVEERFVATAVAARTDFSQPLPPAMQDFKDSLERAVRSVLEDARKRRRDGTAAMSGALYTETDEAIFQLVPGVASSARCGVRGAVWNDGYWHIARSQVMQFKHDIGEGSIPNGALAATSGKLLEVTFAPVWIEPLADGTPCGVATRTGKAGTGSKAGAAPPPPPTMKKKSSSIRPPPARKTLPITPTRATSKSSRAPEESAVEMIKELQKKIAFWDAAREERAKTIEETTKKNQTRLEEFLVRANRETKAVTENVAEALKKAKSTGEREAAKAAAAEALQAKKTEAEAMAELASEFATNIRDMSNELALMGGETKALQESVVVSMAILQTAVNGAKEAVSAVDAAMEQDGVAGQYVYVASEAVERAHEHTENVIRMWNDAESMMNVITTLVTDINALVKNSNTDSDNAGQEAARSNDAASRVDIVATEKALKRVKELAVRVRKDFDDAPGFMDDARLNANKITSLVSDAIWEKDLAMEAAKKVGDIAAEAAAAAAAQQKAEAAAKVAAGETVKPAEADGDAAGAAAAQQGGSSVGEPSGGGYRESWEDEDHLELLQSLPPDTLMGDFGPLYTKYAKPDGDDETYDACIAALDTRMRSFIPDWMFAENKAPQDNSLDDFLHASFYASRLGDQIRFFDIARCYAGVYATLGKDPGLGDESIQKYNSSQKALTEIRTYLQTKHAKPLVAEKKLKEIIKEYGQLLEKSMDPQSEKYIDELDAEKCYSKSLTQFDNVLGIVNMTREKTGYVGGLDIEVTSDSLETFWCLVNNNDDQKFVSGSGGFAEKVMNAMGNVLKAACISQHGSTLMTIKKNTTASFYKNMGVFKSVLPSFSNNGIQCKRLLFDVAVWGGVRMCIFGLGGDGFPSLSSIRGGLADPIWWVKEERQGAEYVSASTRLLCMVMLSISPEGVIYSKDSNVYIAAEMFWAIKGQNNEDGAILRAYYSNDEKGNNEWVRAKQILELVRSCHLKAQLGDVSDFTKMTYYVLGGLIAKMLVDIEKPGAYESARKCLEKIATVFVRTTPFDDYIKNLVAVGGFLAVCYGIFAHTQDKEFDEEKATVVTSVTKAVMNPDDHGTWDTSLKILVDIFGQREGELMHDAIELLAKGGKFKPAGFKFLDAWNSIVQIVPGLVQGLIAPPPESPPQASPEPPAGAPAGTGNGQPISAVFTPFTALAAEIGMLGGGNKDATEAQKQNQKKESSLTSAANPPKAKGGVFKRTPMRKPG